MPIEQAIDCSDDFLDLVPEFAVMKTCYFGLAKGLAFSALLTCIAFEFFESCLVMRHVWSATCTPISLNSLFAPSYRFCVPQSAITRLSTGKLLDR